MAKILVVDAPHGTTEYPWSPDTQQRFGFDADDVAFMGNDNVLWRSEDDFDVPVAYTLEDEE